MKEKLNKVLNDHYRREYEKVGDRYFDQDWVGDLLDDRQLVGDIIELSRELSPIDKRLKQG